MKHLEFDIDKIALIGEQKEEENFDFRIFLKGLDSNRVDSIVHQLEKEIKSQIDCQKCGNCCKTLRPCVTDSEIEILSQIVGCSQIDFESHFLETDSFENIKYLKDTPCKFLKEKSCSIYIDRPEDCKSYPHTQKADFISRTLGMNENYSICPIVFNLMESLKDELNYKY